MSHTNHKKYTPALDAVYQDLAESIKGWATTLGTSTSYNDPMSGEGGDYEWATSLRNACDWALRTAESLLVAQGQFDQTQDLKRRTSELFDAADVYEQQLQALEDQRQVRIESITTQYHKAWGEDDPDAVGLMRLYQGIQRIWTLNFNDHPLETPQQFAEAIDRALFEENGANRRARAEVQRQANTLAEHFQLLAQCERTAAPNDPPATDPAATSITASTLPRRGKRGPARMPLEEAWHYLTIVQAWAHIQDRNRKLPQRDRLPKYQFVIEHEITVRQLNAMLAWYAKHHRETRFPKDPRTLSRDELEQWFVSFAWSD